MLIETDGPSKQMDEVGVAVVRINADEKGQECKDSSCQQSDHNPVTSPHRLVDRMISSPPAPDIKFLRRSASPDGERPRPLSLCESMETELSKSVTPQHRRLLANMASGSPKQDRRKVKGCLHTPALTLVGGHKGEELEGR